MRKLLGILIVCFGLFSIQSMDAQDRNNVFRIYSPDGQELFLTGTLEEVLIYAKKPTARELRRGRKKLAKLTRLRWNIHKVYPYALKVASILEGVQDTLNMLVDEDLRKEYIKSRETALFGEYEDDLRKMSRSQGKVLVQLVYRETGHSTFHLIKDFKSGASALFWQSIGLIFGINLKKQYNPTENEMIESIVGDLERGGYNIAYKKYNYELP